MPGSSIAVTVCMVIVLGAAIWWVVCRLVRWLGGFRNVDPLETGPVIDSSGWGSVQIGWTSLNNCVKVEGYEQGWALRLTPLLGGGRRWARWDETEIGPIKTKLGGLLRTRFVQVGPTRFEMVGRLADWFDVAGKADG